MRETLLATGCYSRAGRGRGPGIQIRSLRREPASETTPAACPETTPVGTTACTLSSEVLSTLEVPDPSFLLWGPTAHLLYAITETSPARLLAVSVSADGRDLTLAADLTLTGSGACHLAFGPNQRSIIVSHYGSGMVETVTLDADGLPERTLDVHDHRSLLDATDRSEVEPHPHQAVVLPLSQQIAVCDLGLDRVLLYRQAPDGTLDLSGEIPLPAGTGPRHLTSDHEASSLLIAGELDGTLALLVRTTDGPVPESTEAATPSAPYRFPLRAAVLASASSAPNAPSHVELTAQEDAVLIANRGPDTLALFSLDEDLPHLVAEAPVGEHPRHFTCYEDLVLVAAQESDRIDLLRRTAGTLEVCAEPWASPSVTCIAIRPVVTTEPEGPHS